MWRSVGAIVLALGAGALAAPATPAPPTWADWVGDWTGKLAWTSCSADGNDSATLPIEAVDGTVSIDLTPAGGALTSIAILPDPNGWTGQQSDVTVHVSPSGKASTLSLAIDLDSGCEIRGTLKRPSTGIDACDQLTAWARIESQCTKLTRPPLENAARIARQREQWRVAKGETKTKLGAQCATRAAKLEASMIDVGCAPSHDPQIGLRGAQCQALRSTSERLGRCGNVPFDVRQALEREVVVLVAASQGADKSALPVVESECKAARDRLLAIGKQAGCPL
jgi:hypothetical protein